MRPIHRWMCRSHCEQNANQLVTHLGLCPMHPSSTRLLPLVFFTFHHAPHSSHACSRGPRPQQWAEQAAAEAAGQHLAVVGNTRCWCDYATASCPTCCEGGRQPAACRMLVCNHKHALEV